MKKLIALFAVTTLASTAAMAGVAITGAASVSYDDNGSAASAVSTDATLTVTGSVGTVGGSITTVAASFSLEDDVIATDSVTMTSAIGPITVSADLYDEDSTAAAGTDDGDGDKIAATVDGNDTSVTVSLSAPVGDATIALDNSGDITVSGTFSGVTISHTIQDGSDSTTGSASIAGMDISLTNDGGATSWSIGTTVSGVALTLDSDNDISATFGLSGNTMTVSHVGARAEVATTATNYSTEAAAAYTTVAVSRSLTSGATLAATYSTSDDSLTLKASVSF
jgi:hypothetical protein